MALVARQLHPWRFELDFFPSRLPCGQPYKFRFKTHPIWYFAIHKVYEIALSEVLATQMGVTERSIKVSSSELYKLDPFSPHSGNSCIVMLWVACELLQFAATQ